MFSLNGCTAKYMQVETSLLTSYNRLVINKPISGCVPKGCKLIGIIIPSNFVLDCDWSTTHGQFAISQDIVMCYVVNYWTLMTSWRMWMCGAQAPRIDIFYKSARKLNNNKMAGLQRFSSFYDDKVVIAVLISERDGKRTKLFYGYIFQEYLCNKNTTKCFKVR